MLHDTLWNENAEVVRRCLEHPFVRRLAAGTLDRETFRRYVAQDAFFLRAFFRAYGLAAAQCDDFDHARRFHELMASVLVLLRHAMRIGFLLGTVGERAVTVAMTIAGSGPSGRAGVQADLKTFHQHGVYGTSVVTFLTVQNTQVESVEVLGPEFVVSQLDFVPIRSTEWRGSAAGRSRRSRRCSTGREKGCSKDGVRPHEPIWTTKC